MKTLGRSLILGIAWWASTMALVGQTIERDTTITGPRGNSIERQVEIKRTPGSLERQIQIKRPGGTFERQVQIQRSPGGVRRGPLVAGPWPRPPWIPRTVVIGQPAPALGFGLLAVPALNFSFGGGGGFPIGGPPAAPAPPPDEVALMTQRLQSFYWNNRKEAAYTLGRLGNPRAVPSLIHVLKYDLHKDVRIAGAIALGEIGGSEAAIALERASIYDHKEDVRRAAATAMERLNAKAKSPPPESLRGTRSRPSPMPPEPATGSPFRESPAGRGAAPEPPAGGTEPAVPPDSGSNQPPPPPTPVTGKNPDSAN
jgi:hypothetical protein